MSILIFCLLALANSLQNGSFSSATPEIETLGFKHEQSIPPVVGGEGSVSVEDLGVSRPANQRHKDQPDGSMGKGVWSQGGASVPGASILEGEG